jgi:hypothetical protein
MCMLVFILFIYFLFILCNLMFVTVCYFHTEEIFLSEGKGWVREEV